MSITVVVRSAQDAQSGEAPELTFDGSRIVIGRGSGCDVRLPDPSVSHRHASLRVEHAEYTLVDEGSRNGTFVGGERLVPHAPHPIPSGTRIRVGRVWLELRIDQTPPTRELAQATRDLAMSLVARAMDKLGDNLVPKVRVREGNNCDASIDLTEDGRGYVIGRGVECDFTLADKDVSRQHICVTRRSSAVFLRDLESKNGATLGDAQLSRFNDLPWKPSILLRLGRTVLALEEPVAAALAEIEGLDDEPFSEDVADLPAPNTPGGSSRGSDDASAASNRNVPGANEVPPGAAGEAKGASGLAASKGGSYTTVDVAVLITALTILVLSAAGLVWLFRK